MPLKKVRFLETGECSLIFRRPRPAVSQITGTITNCRATTSNPQYVCVNSSRSPRGGEQSLRDQLRETDGQQRANFREIQTPGRYRGEAPAGATATTAAALRRNTPERQTVCRGDYSEISDAKKGTPCPGSQGRGVSLYRHIKRRPRTTSTTQPPHTEPNS